MEKKIKKTFACAGVNHFQIDSRLNENYTPKAGDVAVFELLTRNGNTVMGEHGQSVNIFPGDYLLAVFGNRYATSQYEGYVPENPVSHCQLIARGGVAGLSRSVNHTFKYAPEELRLVGYAVDSKGVVINAIQWQNLQSFDPNYIPAKIILSVGSSMDSGKTTTAGYLCAGLERAGYRAAYLKLTGTTYPKDVRFVVDRGACFGLDFSHFGFPSTYLCERSTLLDIYTSLLKITAENASPDYIVVEIADGLFQRETRMLLTDPVFMSTVSGVILSCGDSLGVLTGLNLLEQYQCPPFAVAGRFTSSELLIQEVNEWVQTPVLQLGDLLEGAAVPYLEPAEALAVCA